MSSLAEVYEGLGEEASLEQLYLGTGLFVAGALLVIAGIAVATTDVLAVVGVSGWRAWEPAGVLAGLGLPAVFVGVFVVLPASRTVRAAAAIGASVAVLGVALFEHAYPHRWHGDPTDLTALVALVYFAGAITTFACLFVAVANFKTRNDPGGTVTLEITRGGETRIVEVDAADLPEAIEDHAGHGSVGLLGADPDGSVPTQTASDAGMSSANRSGRTRSTAAGSTAASSGAGPGSAGSTRTSADTSGRSDSASGPVADRSTVSRSDEHATVTRSGGSSHPAQRTPASDGGATDTEVRTPGDGAEVTYSAPEPEDATDTYCGNCRHFQYVQSSRGMRPYCGFHDGVMDDMDACEEWTPNRLD